MDLGRTAVFADPSGARFSVWQPGTHTGFDVAGESGGVSWTELYTRDESAAFDFYREVFGWGSSSMPFPDGSGSYRMAYPVGEGPDAMFGGFVPLNSDPVEKGSAPHWLLYFEVDDCDATVATAGDLGATVRMAPTDIEGVGRFAKLGDPNGAGFAVMHGIPST
jgi:predicted enzyme related to lactoylglutathione lyase